MRNLKRSDGIVEFIRKTITGSEYWDSEGKRTVFVPKGEDIIVKEPQDETPVAIDLTDMNAEQLLEYAKQNDVSVPGTMKKEETIRKYIEESMVADTE